MRRRRPRIAGTVWLVLAALTAGVCSLAALLLGDPMGGRSGAAAEQEPEVVYVPPRPRLISPRGENE